jgi:transcriptional regulator with XRE-family HTH domain
LGDHISKIRIDRNESQSCVAHLLSVTTDIITNWELNRNIPHVKYAPKIIEYLEYTPLFDLAGNTLSKRVQQLIFTNGLTQKDCAMRFGLDPATIRRTIEEKIVNQKTRDNLQNRISGASKLLHWS